MAITKDDFNKIWASTSPLTPYSFTESNYKEGWNFVGSTPPARQMWDFLQKNNDEKMQFIVNDICVPVDVTEESDTDTAYSVSVPSDKVFANINKFYGKTWAWNQLCKNDGITDTVVNVVCTNNGNGSWTFNGTANGDSSKTLASTTIQIVSGHKYLFKGCPSGGSSTTYFLGVSGYRIDEGSGAIWTAPSSFSGTLRLDIKNGASLSNATTYPMVFDLTLMFGAGNEPTTVAEFETLFPADYYPYNAGTLISASVSNVKSKDSSNNVIANMPIPSAIQSLPCYGASAGSVSNYIDFERKVYVQNVASVDMGSLAWAYTSYDGVSFFYVNLPTLNVSGFEQDTVPNIICPIYVTKSRDGQTTDGNKTISANGNGNIILIDSSYTDAVTFKSAMSGVMLYYELATPIEHDISDILGATGIVCEENGSLTFENSNGADYQLPVQYDLDFVEGTDGLMTAQDKSKLEVAYEVANQNLLFGLRYGEFTSESTNFTANQEVLMAILPHKPLFWSIFSNSNSSAKFIHIIYNGNRWFAYNSTSGAINSMIFTIRYLYIE